MGACNILDVRCVLVNELIGSAVLSVLIASILYFVAASKLNFGFETTIFFAIPIILIFGIALTSFSIIFAFVTFAVGMLVAYMVNKMFMNR